MPDLDIVVMAQCTTNIEWERQVTGSKGDQYTVRFERVNEQVRGVLYDYTCNCPAYKKCKHIKQVKDERCGWDQLLHGEDPVRLDEDPWWECPRCGGGVDFYRAGV